MSVSLIGLFITVWLFFSIPLRHFEVRPTGSNLFRRTFGLPECKNLMNTGQVFCLQIIFMPTWIIMFSAKICLLHRWSLLFLGGAFCDNLYEWRYLISFGWIRIFQPKQFAACDRHRELVVSDTLLIKCSHSAATISVINYLVHSTLQWNWTRSGRFSCCRLDPVLSYWKREYCIGQDEFWII